MKKIFIVSLLIFYNFFFAQKVLKIGKYEYYKKKSVSVFLKDDGFDAKYDVYATKDNRKKFGCKASAKRNDSIFQRGYMTLDIKNRTIKCRELFYYKQSYSVDSIQRYYKQNNDGSFRVLKIQEFKNGKIQYEYQPKY